VAGFIKTPPNTELLRFAERELRRLDGGHALDIGCGAGRNALPLVRQGWHVLALDSSEPMLQALAHRVRDEGRQQHCHLARSFMVPLPVRDRSCNLLVAHGIWNLARSGAEFRAAVHEASRVARPGAGLFVFTFSRATLRDDARPIEGESFVFRDFSGEPQCFLTAEQLVGELSSAGFVPDAVVPLRELNRRQPHALPTTGVPVIHQGSFRLTG
jgi:ubiquinone/menaquinone biosynthesis C-methylase UbiE